MSGNGDVRVDPRTLPSPIDRTKTGKNKSIGNRERFLRKYKKQIRDAVKRAVDGKDIRDIGKDGISVPIDKNDTREYVFGHGPGGKREMVHPGNKEYVVGDRIERPKGGKGGKGKGQASDSGEGEDDFTFNLSKKEFMDIFFEDLALPNLIRTTLSDTPDYKYQRAGYTNEGAQANLALLPSMIRAGGRHIVLHRRERKELLEKLEELQVIVTLVGPRTKSMQTKHDQLIVEIDALETKIGRNPEVEALRPLQNRITALIAKLRAIPYLDPQLDLRFRARQRVPMPHAKAVMFCLMDISGSMDENRKDLSKRFFILLYLFLTRHYDKIDIVFIRHHTQATEVTEEEFFHSTETGGTIVSSALKLMSDIARERYPTSEWNIYGAQASDGDNWHHDSGLCRELLNEKILPLCRYFAYLQVADEEQELWQVYKQLSASHDNFAMDKATDPSQIYPVFRKFFKKEEKA